MSSGEDDTRGYQRARGQSEFVHTMSSGEDDTRGYQRATALVEVNSLLLDLFTVPGTSFLLQGFLVQDCTHVGPFSKLRLGFFESLDPDSKTIFIPPSALGRVLDLWRRWRNKVGILAAHVKKPGTFAVFWCKAAKAVPDVYESCSVSDDRTVMTLIVGDTFVSKGLGVVGAVFKVCVNLNCR